MSGEEDNMHTEEEVLTWVKKNRDELIQSLHDNAEIPGYLKTPGDRFEEVWCAGCWLNKKLEEAGATEEEVRNIGFAHGQRSLFGNTYRWALNYLNEFESAGAIKDKPGIELADEINKKHLLVGDGFIAIALEENS
jgi:hypothetical protein